MAQFRTLCCSTERKSCQSATANWCCSLQALALLLVQLCTQTCYGQDPSEVMVSAQNLTVMISTDGKCLELSAAQPWRCWVMGAAID